MSERRRGSWFKWMAVGTLSFLAFLLITAAAVGWFFSPLLSEGQFKVGGLVVNDALKSSMQSQGEMRLTSAVKLVYVPFNSAKLELTNNERDVVAWNCRSTAGTESPKMEVKADVATLNLDVLQIANCLLSLPAKVAAQFQGVNGHMEVSHPSAPLDIHLDNGRVRILTSAEHDYDFDAHVKNGLQDFFPRSAKSDAIKVRISVINGMVSK